jgi:sugar lactone lactonase YvrE
MPLPEVVGSIALCERGGFLAAMRSGFHAVDPETGTVEQLLDPEADRPENRFNDGRVDRRGRFWAGTMNDVRRDPTGALYRLDADLACTRHREDVIVPNSIAWSPDDRVMYFADTYRHHILVFDFDAAEGRISGERLFAKPDGPGRPDGSCVDAEGCLWNAEYAGGRIVRWTPDGRIDRVVELPVSQPTCCCFGGSGLDTLFVTSATQRLPPGELAKQPLAGGVFAVRVGVRGLPEARFAG